MRVKKDLSDLLAQLIKDLKPDFAAQQGPDLPASDKYGAEIILGIQ